MLGGARGAASAAAVRLGRRRASLRLALEPLRRPAARLAPSGSLSRTVTTSGAASSKALPRAQTTAGSSAFRAVGGTKTIFGVALLGAVAYVAYEMVESGRTFESILDDIRSMLSSSLDEHTDPQPDDFLPSMLQAQLIPEAMQDGRMDEPYTTYVMQLEGTLLRKEHDRRAGFKHMIRPHAENTLRLLSKASKGKGHVWFWGSEQQAMVSQLTESLFLGSETERGVGMSVFQGLAPAFLGKEHRFKDFAGEEAAMERRREKGDTDQAPAGVDITQRLARDHFLVKRVEPLPRYTPSVVLVDHELRNYELNPDNTILVPEFVEYKVDDDALLTVVAFAHLFHSLYKRKEVRTASDALRWVRKRHPDISINPYAMGRHIREESSAITRELDLMERSSLSAVAKQVSKHTIFGSGRAITPSSTRLGAEHMPEGSLVARQVAAMKKRNAAWQAAQIKAAKKAAGEE